MNDKIKMVFTDAEYAEYYNFTVGKTYEVEEGQKEWWGGYWAVDNTGDRKWTYAERWKPVPVEEQVTTLKMKLKDHINWDYHTAGKTYEVVARSEGKYRSEGRYKDNYMYTNDRGTLDSSHVSHWEPVDTSSEPLQEAPEYPLGEWVAWGKAEVPDLPEGTEISVVYLEGSPEVFCGSLPFDSWTANFNAGNILAFCVTKKVPKEPRVFWVHKDIKSDAEPMFDPENYIKVQEIL